MVTSSKSSKSRSVRVRVVEEEGIFDRSNKIFPKHIRSKSFYPRNPRVKDFESICDLLTKIGFSDSLESPER